MPPVCFAPAAAACRPDAQRVRVCALTPAPPPNRRRRRRRRRLDAGNHARRPRSPLPPPRTRPPSPAGAREPVSCSSAPQPPQSSQEPPPPPPPPPPPEVQQQQQPEPAASLTSLTVDASLLTPMMRHWVETKRAYPQYLVLYRVGDFFETFFEDAAVFSSICNLALTAKDAGKALGARVPMSGVPHYTLDEKCRILLAHSVNVAVVDQVEAASDAAPGELVRRAVTRLVTPGTLLDDTLLDTTRDNFLACVSVASLRAATLDFGLALADVCTGELRATDGAGLLSLERLLRAAEPAEVLIPALGSVAVNGESSLSADWSARSSAAVKMQALVDTVRRAGVPVITVRPASDFSPASCTDLLQQRYVVDNIESLGCRGRRGIVSAVGALLSFVSQTVEADGRGTVPFRVPQIFSPGDNLEMDQTAIRNLEVVETLRDGPSGKSLRWAVDRTVTAMGARRVRAWLLAPLKSRESILYRQRIVGCLVGDRRLLDELQTVLRSIADLERLAGRVGGDRASPRDVQRLSQSLLRLPEVGLLLRTAEESVKGEGDVGLVDRALSPFRNILMSIGDPGEQHANSESDYESMLQIASAVADAFVDPAPSLLLSARVPAQVAGNSDVEPTAYDIFRDGFNEELDALRASRSNPDIWMSLVESEEQARTGIVSLRVKRMRNTGYVFRVARSVAERRLEEDPLFFSRLGYERSLSTKTEMRFKSASLTEREKDEHAVARAIISLEHDLFQSLLERFTRLTDNIRRAAAGLAELDALCGFARVSCEQGYVAPEVVDDAESRILYVEDGRHPVVEQNLPSGKSFVPNSFCMGADELGAMNGITEGTAMSTAFRQPPNCDEMILCGPNASGKSCAMRMVGLIVILAQAGCFVPASRMRLGVVDRIFTRVGAVDDMSLGQSTFQVEMAETASILCQATGKSLVLLDEIGRGTAVADGVAIAWAVAEYMAGLHTSGQAGVGSKVHQKMSKDRIPRTIFVTHYHELNELAYLPNVEPFRMQFVSSSPRSAGESANEAPAEEWVYTHRVIPGPSWESHGLAIARRAGFPTEIVERADKILHLLQEPSASLAQKIRFSLPAQAGYSEWHEEGTHTRDRSQTSSGVESDLYVTAFNEGRKSALREVHELVGRLLNVDSSADTDE